MTAETLPLRILVGLLALGCVAGLIHIVSVIGFHVPFDPNEGWNAAFTQATLTTGSPYPPQASLLTNNYPPLSFYLVAAIARITGDAIVAGRVVALLALLATAFGIDRAAHAMGCTPIQSAFAGSLFTAWLMLTTDYAGMDDPQMLGHAVATGGLLLVLHEPRTPRLMVAAAFALTMAFFIKHNLVVLPLALSFWLLLADRHHARTFIISGAVFLLIGLGLFKQIYGFSLLSQIDSARTYALSNIASSLSQWLAWGAVPLGAAALLFVVARHDRHVMLCALYAALSVAAGIYFFGGAGIDANAMFDADIALSLCAALLINRLQLPIWQGATALLFAIPPIIALWTVEGDWRSAAYWTEPMAEERQASADEIALIEAAHGPVLCEMMSLCYWAGKPAEADIFNLEQAYLTGAQSDAPLVRALNRHHYALIQLEQMTPFPLTPALRTALLANFRLIRNDDGRVFFAPR